MKKRTVLSIIVLVSALIFTSSSVSIAGPYEGVGADPASRTFAIPNSATLPATCSVGQSYMDTDATSGNRFYLCESTNTWAFQGASSVPNTTYYVAPDMSPAIVVGGTGYAWTTGTGSCLGTSSPTCLVLSSGGYLKVVNNADIRLSAAPGTWGLNVTIPTGNTTRVVLDLSNGSSTGYVLKTDTSGHVACSANGGGAFQVGTTDVRGSEHVIGCKVSGTTLSPMVDGTAENAGTQTISLNNTTDDLFIGADRNGANPCNCTIDDVFIYNVAVATMPSTTPISTTNLISEWRFDTGVGIGDNNSVARTLPGGGTASDSNNCFTNTTPCLTYMGAINKIPHFYAGNATIYMSSGIDLGEEVDFFNFNPNGPYNLTVRHYINKVPNSFTDSPRLTGTVTSASADGFPTSTKATLNDNSSGGGTPFTSGLTADLKGALLHITGGTTSNGFCADDKKNWYEIEGRIGDTQLSIVAGWECGAPSTTGTATTYEIYYDRDKGTVHGGNNGGLFTTAANADRNKYAVRVLNSKGLIFQNTRAINAYRFNRSIENSEVQEIGNSANNGGYVGHNYQYNTVVTLAKANYGYLNQYENSRFQFGSVCGDMATDGGYVRNFNTGSINSAGLAGYFGSSCNNLRYNLSTLNAYAAWDFEQNFQTYLFEKNRADANTSYGMVAVAGTGITFTCGNTFTGSNYDLYLVNAVVFQNFGGSRCPSDTYKDIQLLNAGIAGLRLGDKSATCDQCWRYNYSGNAKDMSLTTAMFTGNTESKNDLHEWDDFILQQQANVQTTPVSKLGWVFTFTAGTPTAGAFWTDGPPTLVAGHPGNFQGQCGTTAACYWNLVLKGASGFFLANETFLASFTLKTSVGLAAQNFVRVGSMNNISAKTDGTPGASGMFFQRCGNTTLGTASGCTGTADTNWWAVVRNASAQERVDTGIAADDTTNYRNMSIFRDAGTGTVYFLVNDLFKACFNASTVAGYNGNCTVSSNIPTDGQEMGFQYFRSGTDTTTRGLVIDRVSLDMILAR